MNSLTLYHRQQFGVVTVATNDGAISDIVPLSVAQVVAWLIVSLTAQFVIIAASILVEDCVALWGRAVSFPVAYVGFIVDSVSTGWGAI